MSQPLPIPPPCPKCGRNDAWGACEGLGSEEHRDIEISADGRFELSGAEPIFYVCRACGAAVPVAHELYNVMCLASYRRIKRSPAENGGVDNGST